MKTLYSGVCAGRQVKITWIITNWTFGIYTGQLSSRKRIFGIDLGPLELTVVRWTDNALSKLVRRKAQYERNVP